jgi:hypothetical protein
MRHRISYETIDFKSDSKSDHRFGRIHQNDIIMTRSKLLSPTDRLLINLILEGHYKNIDLAALLGISESLLSYRIRRLTKILGQPFSLLSRQSQRLEPDELKVARMAFLNSRSLGHIARTTGLSLYRTRKIVSGLKTQSETKGKLIINQ